jgi:membrane protein
LNEIISFALMAILFGAIYKILPEENLHWSDVMVGAVVTTVLFGIGKLLIGLYLGSSAVASTYGAAGGLMLVLLWTYYSSQVFLLGAEFTKVYTLSRGSRQNP